MNIVHYSMLYTIQILNYSIRIHASIIGCNPGKECITPSWYTHISTYKKNLKFYIIHNFGSVARRDIFKIEMVKCFRWEYHSRMHRSRLLKSILFSTWGV